MPHEAALASFFFYAFGPFNSHPCPSRSLPTPPHPISCSQDQRREPVAAGLALLPVIGMGPLSPPPPPPQRQEMREDGW